MPPESGETEVRRGSNVGPLALTSARRGPVGCISAKNRALLLGRVPPGPRDLQAGGPCPGSPGPHTVLAAPTQLPDPSETPAITARGPVFWVRGPFPKGPGAAAGWCAAGWPGTRAEEAGEPGCTCLGGRGSPQLGPPRGFHSLVALGTTAHPVVPGGPCWFWPMLPGWSCTSRGLGGLLAEGAAHSCGLLVLGK